MAVSQTRLKPPVKITHVLADDPLIKIYGVHNTKIISFVESLLQGYTEKLQSGTGSVKCPNDLLQGKIVLVPRFGVYRRAEIVGFVESARKVRVRFVDIGGQAAYDLSEIRTADVVQQHINFSMLEEAGVTEYILLGVLKTKNWTPENLERVNQICVLPEESLQCGFHGIIHGYPIISIEYANGREMTAFIDFLVSQGFAVPASIEQIKLVLQNKVETKIPTNQFQVPPPGFNALNTQQPILSSTYPFPQSSQPILPTPVPSSYQSYNRPNVEVPSYQRFRGPRPIIYPQLQHPMPQNYIPDTIEVGEQHEVYVSEVIDGMQNFTVQLKTKVKEILEPLMVQINDTPAEPYTAPLQPGTICLGRYAADNSLCRAVVSTVLAEGVNLYFVDFGNSEIVSFSEIYKMRPEFMKYKVIAIRFTLAGSDSYIFSTREAQKLFTDLVTSADNLVMKVTKPEMPLKQYCELFQCIDGKLINIKNIIQDKMKIMKPVQYERIPFKKHTQADVIISYVESPARFFVQLDLNQVQLNQIMEAVERYCATSENKEILFFEDVNENMTVCAQYSEDNKWYRALVVNPDLPGDNVEVLFVDYGNQEVIHYSKLRIMNNEMISLGPMQAVECRLDFDGDLSLREDVVNHFIELIDGNEYRIEVINLLPAKVLLVDLFDKLTKQNVKNILLQKFSPVKDTLQVDSSMRGSSRSPNSPQGNWRDRATPSSGDGDFSAFRKTDIDEPDNIKREPYSRDNGPKRFERNDSKPSDSWPKKPYRDESRPNQNKPREFDWNEKSESRWSQHDDRCTAADDGNSYGRSYESKGRPSGREGRMNNRGGDSWQNDRNGEESDRRSNRSDAWETKKDDGWGSNDKYSKSEEGGWKGNRRNDDGSGNRRFERDTKPNDGDWGGKRDSRPNGDDWGGNKHENRNSRFNDDDWNKDNRKDRFSKPENGEWGGKSDNRFREKRNFGGQSDWNSDNRNDRWNKTSPSKPTYEPAYEKGAQFVEVDYEPGQELEVIVTWFLNPTFFYVIPAVNEDFRKLVEGFQTDYLRRERANPNDLSPNDCVAAQYKDDVVYRARFLRSKPGGAIVRFVDYGNSETVNKDKIWCISNDHCTIPVQAICCKLHNISSIDENTHWGQVEGLDKYFEEEKYTLTFVKCDEEGGTKVWSINLKNTNNEDVGDSLVAQGLAKKENNLKSEELYDISLLRHQVLAVFSAAINSSKSFFVHIEPQKTEIISVQIAALVEQPENLIAIPEEGIVEGKFCLSRSDGEDYFRAMILRSDPSTKTAHIVFIDYGDEKDEVSFDFIKVLPDHLCIYNPQIMECCLHEGENFDKEDEFIEAITDKDLMIKVMDVIDNKLHVILYDIDGNRLPFCENGEEILPAMCSLPILKHKEKVVISHIDKHKVYVQRLDNDVYLTTLRDQLHEFYDNQEVEKVALEVGQFYAAKSAQFEAWYRCKLVDAESKEIFYIDYGNTEPIEDLIAIKPLEKDFFVSPMYCVGISTSVQLTSEEFTDLLNGVQYSVFETKFKSIGANEWFADLKCEKTKKSFADFVAEINCSFTTQSDGVDSTPYTAFSQWKINEEKEARISYVDSPDNIYLQSVEDQPTISVLQEELQISLKKILPIIGPYDEMIAAQNPSDDKWYRAKALSENEVFAVDFGFKLVSPSVKKLPKQFELNTNNYIVPCSLNLQPLNDNFNEETVSRLSQVVKDGVNVTAKLEFIKHSKRFIDVKLNDAYISDTFVEESIATYRSHVVIVSHASSLKEFYIQFNEDQDDITDLVVKMQEAATWESIEPEIGQIYAAQFVDDEQWYRAEIIKIEGDEKAVKFIDYGNESSVSEVKSVPESLKTLPPYAIQCTLHPLPESVDELNAFFVDLVSLQEGSFSAYIINGVEPMMVMIEVDGKTLENVLKEKKAVAEYKMEPAKVGDTVVVAHINSPSSFYVRDESAPLHEIEALLEGIENSEPLTEFKIDDVVAAKSPDDDIWYRAKVIDVTDGVTQVLFLDYGNTSTVSEIRALPDAAKLMPQLAKHCSFSCVPEQGEWPEVANTRFAELTCNECTVFNIEIIEDGDCAIVNLKDNGMNVADELATICKAELTAPARECEKELVILCHISSLNKIWIQFQTPHLDEMINEMANIETFDDIVSAEVGMMVAAPFEEEWYRANIIEKLESTFKVLFIDYGNEAEVSCIKSLPDDLVKLAPLAKCCRLKDLPEDVEMWPVDILEKTKELVNVTNFYLDEIDETGTATLSFCETGESLSKYILNLSNADLKECDNTCSNEESVETETTDADNLVEKNSCEMTVSENAPTPDSEIAYVANEENSSDVKDDFSGQTEVISDVPEVNDSTSEAEKYDETNQVSEKQDSIVTEDGNFQEISEQLSEETSEPVTEASPVEDDKALNKTSNEHDLVKESEVVKVENCDAAIESLESADPNASDEKLTNLTPKEDDVAKESQVVADDSCKAATESHESVNHIASGEKLTEYENETPATLVSKNIEDSEILEKTNEKIEESNVEITNAPSEILEKANEKIEESNVEITKAPNLLTCYLTEYEKLLLVDESDDFEENLFHIKHINSLESFYVQKVGDVERVSLIEKLLEKVDSSQSLIKLENPNVGDLATMKLNNTWCRVEVIAKEELSQKVFCIDNGSVCASDELYLLPEEFRSLAPLVYHCTLELSEETSESLHGLQSIVSKSTSFKLKVLEERENVKVVDLFDDFGSIKEKIARIKNEESEEVIEKKKDD